MIVQVTGMPANYTIPANKAEGRPKDKVVGIVDQRVRVVRVDELVKWCLENSEDTVGSLATAIARGDFG